MSGVVMIIGGVIAVGIATFILEVALAVQKFETRPSTWLAAGVQRMHDGVWYAGYVLGMAADVLGFVRRFAIMIRDVFFDWIPREIIEKALTDFKQLFYQTVTVPTAFFKGLYEAICLAASPLFASTVFTFGAVACVVTLELLALVAPPSVTILAPSSMLLSSANWTYQILYNIVYTVISFLDIFRFAWRFAVWMREYFFPWLSLEQVGVAVENLNRGLMAWMTVWMGPVAGFWKAYGETIARSASVEWTLVGLTSCFAGLTVRRLLAEVDWTENDKTDDVDSEEIDDDDDDSDDSQTCGVVNAALGQHRRGSGDLENDELNGVDNLHYDPSSAAGATQTRSQSAGSLTT